MRSSAFVLVGKLAAAGPAAAGVAIRLEQPAKRCQGKSRAGLIAKDELRLRTEQPEALTSRPPDTA